MDCKEGNLFKVTECVAASYTLKYGMYSECISFPSCSVKDSEKADCVPEYGPKMFCKCCPSGRYDPLPPVDKQTGFFLAQSLRLFQSLFNPATAQLPPAKQRL